MYMELAADEVFAEPAEDDYPFTFGFRDNTADYVLFLSRFSDLEPDEGQIEVVVRDQVCAWTASLEVRLGRSRCQVRLDEPTASRLLGVREYMVDFRADDQTYGQMVEVLRVIFQGLPGLAVEDNQAAAEPGAAADRRQHDGQG
ncbi:MAG: hypothetical protein ACJ8GN_07550 [Longimicrobiaceae bacterium]